MNKLPRMDSNHDKVIQSHSSGLNTVYHSYRIQRFRRKIASSSVASLHQFDIKLVKKRITEAYHLLRSGEIAVLMSRNG